MITDGNDKPIWDPAVEIPDPVIKRRFDELVFEALRAAHPEALRDAP